jgi:ankyrin repeat protein
MCIVHATQCVFSKLMQDVYGNTALINACQHGHVETARVLLDHGAVTDYQNKVKSLIYAH